MLNSPNDPTQSSDDFVVPDFSHISGDLLLSTQDDTPPTVTLLGDQIVTTSYGTPFNDPGVVAYDNVDGQIPY